MSRNRNNNKKGARHSYWVRSDAIRDANGDSRIKGTALQIFVKIAQSFNWVKSHSECSRSYIMDDVPVSIQSVRRGERKLVDTGRIWIIRKGTGILNTLYGVNWYYRGADAIRSANGGEAIPDIREHGRTGTEDRGTKQGTEGVPNRAQDRDTKQGRGVPKCHPNPFPKGNNIAAPAIAGSAERLSPSAQGGGFKTKKKRRAPAGYVEWRVASARCEINPDDELDYKLVVFLRSAVRGSKFTLKLHCDATEYDSFLQVTIGDGGFDPGNTMSTFAGRRFYMSTNREGPKDFLHLRLPDQDGAIRYDVTVTGGEEDGDGEHEVAFRFNDRLPGEEREATMKLTGDQVAALLSAARAEGEAAVIGRRITMAVKGDRIDFEPLPIGNVLSASDLELCDEAAA